MKDKRDPNDHLERCISASDESRMRDDRRGSRRGCPHRLQAFCWAIASTKRAIFDGGAHRVLLCMSGHQDRRNGRYTTEQNTGKRKARARPSHGTFNAPSCASKEAPLMRLVCAVDGESHAETPSKAPSLFGGSREHQARDRILGGGAHQVLLCVPTKKKKI